jgi:hypothetical protein
MTLPRTIDAGWAVFGIQYSAGLEIENEKMFGYVDFDERLVRINTDAPLPMLRETLLHECLHIIFAGVGLGEEKIVTNNENLTEQSTKGLMLFCRLNPFLFKWLLYGEGFYDSK